MFKSAKNNVSEIGRLLLGKKVGRHLLSRTPQIDGQPTFLNNG
jgi:hypothetical protein